MKRALPKKEENIEAKRNGEGRMTKMTDSQDTLYILWQKLYKKFTKKRTPSLRRVGGASRVDLADEIAERLPMVKVGVKVKVKVK